MPSLELLEAAQVSHENRTRRKPPVTLEVCVGYDCNALCRWCNRLVGVANIPDSAMTEVQAKRAVRILEKWDQRIRKITLSGGEPLLNPQLQGIAHQLAKLNPRKGRILCNGFLENKTKTFVMPGKRWRWVVSHVDTKSHVPFLVSPTDLGIIQDRNECTVMHYCGRGLDAYGFSSCGVAGVLGRLLRVNPYHRRRPVIADTPAICRHCIYSLPRDKQAAVQKSIMKGDIKAPTKTWKEGLKEHRTSPMEFEKL